MFSMSYHRNRCVMFSKPTLPFTHSNLPVYWQYGFVEPRTPLLFKLHWKQICQIRNCVRVRGAFTKGSLAVSWK